MSICARQVAASFDRCSESAYRQSQTACEQIRLGVAGDVSRLPQTRAWKTGGRNKRVDEARARQGWNRGSVSSIPHRVCSTTRDCSAAGPRLCVDNPHTPGEGASRLSGELGVETACLGIQLAQYSVPGRIEAGHIRLEFATARNHPQLPPRTLPLGAGAATRMLKSQPESQ